MATDTSDPMDWSCQSEDSDTADRDKSAKVRNDWEVGHWTPDRLIANAASNSVASHSTRAPRRRNTRYNTKTVTKTKKALSVLETVHGRWTEYAHNCITSYKVE